jgi:outer membrane protein
MICAVEAQAQTNKTLSLSLQQAVELAVQHNLDVQIQRYTPLNDIFLLAEATAIYEPAFNTTIQRAWAYQPSSLSATGVQNLSTRSDDTTYSMGIGSAGGGNAVTPWGLNYSVGTTIDKTTFRRFTNGIPFLDDQGTAQTSITLQQPLLRNLWIDANRRDILIAKQTIKYDEYAFQWKAMQIISDTEQAYYELIYDFEDVRVQEMAVRLKQQSYNENQKRVEVGAMAPLDEMQAKSQLATAKAALLLSQQTLGTQETVLKGLITDKYSDVHDVTIVPSEKLIVVPERFDLQESWRTAINGRPDLRQFKVDLERKGITLRYTKNQMYPEVDLIGKYAQKGVESTVDGAFQDIREDLYPTYYYGITMSIPLGARSQRAAYKAAKAMIEQVNLQYKQAEQNILIQVENTVGNLNSSLEKTRATREAREYAEAALEAEQKKLEVGKSTSFQVLSLQNDLTAARQAEIRALADYNKSLALLAQYEGTILDKHHLSVKVK